MYSSKVKVKLSLSKKVVFSFGEALINLGGIESLGPPVGDARLAHFTVHKRRMDRRISEADCFILF